MTTKTTPKRTKKMPPSTKAEEPPAAERAIAVHELPFLGSEWTDAPQHTEWWLLLHPRKS